MMADEFEYYELLTAFEEQGEELTRLRAERDALREVLEDIRDLARTGLPLAGYSSEMWAQHKLVRIAARADKATAQPEEVGA